MSVWHYPDTNTLNIISIVISGKCVCILFILCFVTMFCMVVVLRDLSTDGHSMVLKITIEHNNRIIRCIKSCLMKSSKAILSRDEMIPKAHGTKISQ